MKLWSIINTGLRLLKQKAFFLLYQVIAKNYDEERSLGNREVVKGPTRFSNTRKQN